MHFNPLFSLNLKVHFWSQNFVDVVGAQNYVDFPLATSKVKSASLGLLFFAHTLQLVSVTLQETYLCIVLSVH